MKPERLTHLLIIERASETVSASGAVSSVWTEYARTRAELAEGSMTEERQERGAVTVTEYTFRARYVADVTLADRVIYDEKVFNIVGLAPIGRREGLEIRVRRTGP